MGQTSVRMEFTPSVFLIPIVRRFVSDFYARIISDPDTVSRVAMATHELLENMMKYSIDGGASIAIDVMDGSGPGCATIRIRNRAASHHAEQVVTAIRALNTSDPFEYYQAQMQRTALLTTGSGLGLARVCVEGEMRLDCSENGDWIEVVATTGLGMPT